MVAENTGDVDACKNIKGGQMSYSKDECILDVAVSTENPSDCNLLTGDAHQQCVTRLGPKITADKVLEVDDQIELIKNELAKGSDANLEAQLKGLQDKRKDMMAVMTKSSKTSGTKKSGTWWTSSSSGK